MSRTFLISFVAVTHVVIWSQSRFTPTDRMDDVAIRDFTHQMAKDLGVTDSQIVILNIFELERAE